MMFLLNETKAFVMGVFYCVWPLFATTAILATVITCIALAVSPRCVDDTALETTVMVLSGVLGAYVWTIRMIQVRLSRSEQIVLQSLAPA
jgi:intracellular septation protein A